MVGPWLAAVSDWLEHDRPACSASSTNLLSRERMPTGCSTIPHAKSSPRCDRTACLRTYFCPETGADYWKAQTGG